MATQLKRNKYELPCSMCGQTLKPGEGILRRDNNGRWSAFHPAPRWVGSPVSGRFVGGCPDNVE